MQQLINNNFMVIICIVAVILLFLGPSKPSQKAIRHAYEDFNEFVSDYNQLVRYTEQMIDEIKEKRFLKETTNTININIDKFYMFTNKVLILADKMGSELADGKLSSFRKDLKQAVICLQNIEELYTVLETLSSEGITKEEYERMEEQRHQKEARKNYEEPKVETKVNTFFAGCETMEQAEKRYRSLCKIYHPDNGGDTETFKRISQEYQKVKGGFSR